MKRHILPAFLAVVTAVCLLCGGVFAAEADAPEPESPLCAVIGEGAVVYPQTAADETVLFLPAAANLTQLTLRFDGEAAMLWTDSGCVVALNGQPFDLLSLFPEGLPAEGGLVTIATDTAEASLRILRSESVPALFLLSGSADRDRSWVEQNQDNKAEGSMVLLRPDGTAVYDGALKSIKGRGNSTWFYPKKPYQVKLDKKADLMETGVGTEAEKTWVLLANYCDETLLHNTVSFDIAARLGLAYSPHCRPIDLYYDGLYRGSYLLCEKTEVGKGRVNVADLEKAFEDANPEVEDFDSLPTAQAYDPCGNLYQYVSGLASPEALNGGYLLEIDFGDRAAAEKSWFTTEHGNYVVLKSPEYASPEAVTYISGLFRQFENAVYNGGTDPESGKSYDELMDVDSLVRFYLLTELSMDPDSFLSSCFFYKPADEEKLYAGPVWDFDSAYGSSVEVFPVDDAVAARNPLVRALLRIPSFREKAAAVCTDELVPIIAALLSGKPGVVPTLDGYASEIAASRRMNDLLWPSAAPEDSAEALEAFRALLLSRVQWLERCLYADVEASPLTAAFFDVSLESWYHDDVLFITERGIFNGTAYGYFSPDLPFTRSMAVTILYRMAGQPSVAELSDCFSDVSVGAWYRDAALWAAANGVAMGYEDGSFRPEETITRQDFVTLFYRWAGSPETGEAAADFPDLDLVADYARDAVDWAANAGLLHGDSHGRLLPQDTMTRAQVAALLHRYLTPASDTAETMEE